MTMIVLFIKYLYQDLFAYLASRYRLAKFRAKNRDSRIYRSAKISNSSVGKYCVIFEDVILIDSVVDNHTYVQRNTRIVNTQIGKFCSIAADVSIGPGLHRTNVVSTHPSFYLKNTPLIKTFTKKDLFIPTNTTYIGSDVWIGEKVVILDGVKIGDGAIIAAGSIVTKDVEDYSIVGGIPAKHIKFRFEKDVIKKLLDSKWWNQSEKWLTENQPQMLDLNAFLNS